MTASNAVEFEAVAATISPAQTVSTYIQQFNQFARKSTDSVLEMAKIVAEAKTQLSKTEFPEFCAGIGFDKGDAFISKMKKIGERYEQFKPNAAKLPIAWTTLYRLAGLPVEVFFAGIESGQIHAQMTARELEQIAPMARSNQPASAENPRSEADPVSGSDSAPKTNFGFRFKFNAALLLDKREEFEREVVALAQKYGCELEAE